LKSNKNRRRQKMLEHTPNYIPLMVFGGLIFAGTVVLYVVFHVKKVKGRW